MLGFLTCGSGPNLARAGSQGGKGAAAGGPLLGAAQLLGLGYMPLEAAEPVTLLGRRVPARTTVWIAMWGILQNHPEVRRKLGDDLRNYRPSRWLGSEGIIKHTPFDALGYGHGARLCVGMPLANYEGQLVLARVLQKFVLEWTKAPLNEVSYGLTSNVPDEAVSINLRDRQW